MIVNKYTTRFRKSPSTSLYPLLCFLLGFLIISQVNSSWYNLIPTSANSKSERSASQSAETVAVSNRVVASRSSRQPRLSFSSFAPSSENDYPKKLKSDKISPKREEVEVPVSAEEEEEEEVKRTWNLRPRKACGGLKKGNGVFTGEACGGGSEVKNQKSGGGMEPKSNRQRGIPAESPGFGGGEVTNENHRLWVALSREEIEEDLFGMSGRRRLQIKKKNQFGDFYFDFGFNELSSLDSGLVDNKLKSV